MPMIMQQYQNRMVEPRVIFSKVVNRLISRAQPHELGLFLLHHCVLNSMMTEPLSRWVNEAATRCQQQGYGNLAEDLKNYADIGFQRHTLFQRDVTSLVKWFNKQFFWDLEASAFLQSTVCEGVMQYLECHERALAGSAPFTELAIQFEMERLEMIHGYSLIQLCVMRFGKSILKQLSAFRHQMRLNRQRTTLLEQMLQSFLLEHPEKLPEICDAGIDTLQSYAQYLLDCHQLALASSSSLSA